MQVVAVRAASGGSGDTQAPSVPTTVTATAVSSTQVNVGWTASNDNVGVTQYRVERCQGAGCGTFAEVGSAAKAGDVEAVREVVSSSSSRLRAGDAAGSRSGHSSPTRRSSDLSGDTQAPSVPTTVTATAVSSTQVNVGWTASNDNVGVTQYRVERCQGAGCGTFAEV